VAEYEKLLAWLEVNDYPEKAEIVRRMIDRSNKLLEFVKCQAEMLNDETAQQILEEIGEI
jgi:hypothetical protein